MTRPNPIATAFKTYPTSSTRVNDSSSSNGKNIRLQVTKPPGRGISVHENLGFIGSAIPLEETLSCLKAIKAVPKLSFGQKFALMPASEVGLKWFIGEKDCTETMYAVARNKNQTPMVLISKPRNEGVYFMIRIGSVIKYLWNSL